MFKTKLPSVYWAPFAISALFGVYVKGLILATPFGYLALSRFLGRSSQADFRWQERLALYGEDLLLSGVVVPALGVLAMALVAQRRRPFVVVAIASVFVLSYFAAMLSLGNIGILLDGYLVADAFHWAVQDPHSIGDYVSLASLLKLLLMVCAVAVSVGLAAKADARAASRMANAYALGQGAVFGPMFIAAVLVWLYSMSTPFYGLTASHSATRRIVSQLIRTTHGAGVYKTLDVASLRVEYDKLAGTISRGEQAAQFGVAANNNVLLFVLETAHVATVDFDRELAEGGLMSALRGSAIVSRQHHSTYPYTSDAIYSILSSVYPVGRKNSLVNGAPSAKQGWVAVLAANGWATDQYAPESDSFEDDTQMYEAFGFQRRHVAVVDGTLADAIARRAAGLINSSPGAAYVQRTVAEKKLLADMMAWEQLKSDVRRHSSAHRPFLAMFAPQLGHGPWLNFAHTSDIDQRGRYLVQIQLQWLKELVSELQHSGDLQRTIIIVTADHGPRTQTEYPALRQGALTDVSMRVPLLVYSAAATPGLRRPLPPTSHIDIGPTVLNWLGLPIDQPFIAGLPIEQINQERVLYFFGQGYLGADSYRNAHGYVSCESFGRSCLFSPDMSFNSANSTPASRTAAEAHLTNITRMSQIQYRAAELNVQRGSTDLH